MNISPKSLFLAFTFTCCFENLNLVAMDCLHPPTCKFCEVLTSKPSKLLFDMPSDPHDFSLTIAQMKLVEESSLLCLPPKELYPWSSQVYEIRKKKGLDKTILLDLGDNNSRYSHFWLYPKIVEQMLSKNKVSSIDNQIKDITKRTDELLKKLKEKKILFILTHDALMPFFQDSQIETLILHFHGHHEEKSTIKVMKKLANLKQTHADYKRVWIIETGVPLHPTLKEKMQTDHNFNLDLSQTSQSIFEPLIKLLDELENIVKSST